MTSRKGCPNLEQLTTYNLEHIKKENIYHKTIEHTCLTHLSLTVSIWSQGSYSEITELLLLFDVLSAAQHGSSKETIKIDLPC